jgi:hypothetical protein
MGATAMAETDLPPTPLEEEMRTFEENREKLLGSEQGKYVLIRGNVILGSYVSESDAISEGYRQCGNVPFLVKQVLTVERPLNFLTRPSRIAC